MDLSKEIFEHANWINKVSNDAYRAGYKRGFEDGKRADLEKEMAERIGPEGQTNQEEKAC